MPGSATDLRARLEALGPEARTILRSCAKKNREELGPDWAKIKAEQIARETAPALSRLLQVLQPKVKP